ncbi:MAG: PPC domain-containing protein [Deltaproteobacteria bacterium]|nr:PPC domain-containing protein [Deltaproteobacteria bacterium]
MLSRPATRVAILISLFGAAACTEERSVTPLYNHANARIVIEMNQSLGDGEKLYTRARRGNFNELDCAKLMNEIQAVEDASGETIDGPVVDNALTKSIYDSPQWLNPTPAMIASLSKGVDSIIDVCIMDGDKEVLKIERDLFQAWDQARGKGIGGKADDPSGEQRINSPQAYGERCVAELGEIPFFEKTGEGTYSTYNCLDSTPIPMTVTATDGSVSAPQDGTVNQCDNPQYIYSLCEAGPRVASRINDQGTRWVLLCRKSIGGFASDQFNDIAMIGSNPFTGKTCFFQNALYSKKDGGKVPHPADVEKSANLWSGVHGGLGSGIQCTKCHDADAFIHTPWIDGAKDSNGRPIVPKMGVDPDFAIGANDIPYAIVNRRGQGWTMEKHITGDSAAACTKCHRMGSGEWADSYLSRLNGTDTTWVGITTAHGNKAEHKYWMPPEHNYTTDAQWQASPEKKALEFIQSCNSNMANPACGWKDVPETLGGAASGGKLRNPVTLSDDELAKQATTILGMNKNVQGNKICSDCHTANTTTLNDWQDKTDGALAEALKDADLMGEVVDETSPGVRIENGEFKVLGPYEVAAGSFFEISIAGTGDVDLYVKRGEEPTKSVYDCRPFAQSSTEKCDKSMYNASGPAKFWIALNGTQDGTVKLTGKYTKPHPNAIAAKDRVKMFRLDPAQADSPYVPARVGIYAAAVHLGWFQDTFKAAFPAGQNGNSDDTWALEYGKFKGRTSMPKGNHPRLDQPQFDIVAEWFARGLPRMSSYIAPDTGPTSCSPSITPAVGTHVSDMAVNGWGAANRTAGLAMFGCNGSNPRECLGSLPTAQSKPYGNGWAKVGNLKVLKELTYNTYYWMRSSADGRFVANGRTGGDGAAIEDLQTGKIMSVKAAYDPGFFPDNKTWMFQGTPIGAGFCKSSLLQSNPDRIDFSESACSSVESVSLYQHLGQGVNGGDYFVINSQFTSDNPSGAVNRDPSTGFASSATLKITPMVFDGTHYVGKTPVTTNAPYEGDSVLSPSSKLAISRFGNENGQLGFVLRKLTATPSGNTYSVSTQEIGRYCISGAKPSFSFDEKYIVTHHYVGPNDWRDLGFSSAEDATFKEMLAKGTANIILVNIVTGVRTRVTNMQPGQYAIFPHFRSDGWFYFLVRDKNSNKEYAVASDAALTNP